MVVEVHRDDHDKYENHPAQAKLEEKLRRRWVFVFSGWTARVTRHPGPEVRSREASHDHANDYKVEKATHREYRRQRNTSHADVRREHVSSTSKLSHEVKKPPAERAHAC